MKLPKIPFLGKPKPKRRALQHNAINGSADVARIERELAYEKRVSQPSKRLTELQERMEKERKF